MSAVGILGLGTYLPPTVRTNDWWSSQTVARWSERMAHQATRSEAPAQSLTRGQELTLAGMAEYVNDPFRGAIERRIMPESMSASEMEAHSAREAIKRAGIDPSEIGAILSNSPAPDRLLVNNACVTHKMLGLSQRCLTVATESMCNGFPHHMTLATALIASGQAKYVLSVHSATLTRLTPSSEPHSAWFGDGAAAVVIGAVPEGRGLLAAVHNSDGAQCDALVIGTGSDTRYWQNGELTVHSVDRNATRNMLMGMVDRGGAAVTEALAKANVRPNDVGFYATHQSTAWLTRASAAAAGLQNVPTIVTFPKFANMSSVNIPFILAMAEREGMLRDGSVVATFSGGTGETWSSLVLRWGHSA